MASRYDSDSESEEEMLELYHYSSKENVDKIMDSQVIKQSVGPGDILLGKGVYFTTLSPHASKDEIKENNWDGNSSTISDTKVEAVIKVSIPSDEVRECTTNGGREIYMKRGDVDLTEYPHKADNIAWNETEDETTEDETSSSDDETSSTEDKTSSTEDKTSSTEDKTSSTEDETSSSEDETSSSED